MLGLQPEMQSRHTTPRQHDPRQRTAIPQSSSQQVNDMLYVDGTEGTPGARMTPWRPNEGDQSNAAACRWGMQRIGRDTLTYTYYPRPAFLCLLPHRDTALHCTASIGYALAQLPYFAFHPTTCQCIPSSGSVSNYNACGGRTGEARNPLTAASCLCQSASYWTEPSSVRCFFVGVLLQVEVILYFLGSTRCITWPTSFARATIARTTDENNVLLTFRSRVYHRLTTDTTRGT